MMNRDDFKNFSAGVIYHQTKTQTPTLKPEEIDKFVDGAVMAYDKLTRHKPTLEQQIIEQLGKPPSFSEYTMPESKL